MPHFTVDLFEGRDQETKRRLVRRLTETTCEVLGCEPGAVTIVLRDCPKENWAAAGVLFSDKPAKK